MVATAAPPYKTGQDDQFVIYEGVPVWKENERNGRKFDADVMRRVVENCNHRIEDTGDLVPITIGHTDPDDPSKDLPVVGYADEFEVTVVGKDKPKVGIRARLRFYREQHDKVRGFPRHSVEYVARIDDPYNGWFDSIALLGATPAELDLGVRYARDGVDLLREHYQADWPMGSKPKATPTPPAGGNAMIPGQSETVKDRDLERHDYGQPNDPGAMGRHQGGTLSEADLRQWVQACTPVIRSIVEEVIAARQAGGLGMVGSDPNMGNPPGFGVEDPGMGPATSAPMGGVAGQPGAGVNGAPIGGQGAAPPQKPTGAVPLDKEGAAKDDSGDDDDDAKRDVERYMANGNELGARLYLRGLDRDSLVRLTERFARDGACTFSHLLRELEDASMSQNAAIDAPVVDGEPLTVERYNRTATEAKTYKEQYERERKDKLRLQAELDQAKAELEKHRFAREKAEIDSHLATLQAEGVTFDMDEERTRLTGFTPDQRTAHFKTMREHYRRVPQKNVHIPDAENKDSIGVDDGPSLSDRKSYGQEAVALIERYQRDNKTLEFNTAYGIVLHQHGVAEAGGIKAVDPKTL